ncbi:hypothetical protein RUND412_004643 [Rhizina undulata]
MLPLARAHFPLQIAASSTNHAETLLDSNYEILYYHEASSPPPPTPILASRPNRPPYKWQGYKLTPFTKDFFLFKPPEQRYGVFYSSEHKTGYKALRKKLEDNRVALARLHAREIQLFLIESEVKKDCGEEDLVERRIAKDTLRFQQLWEAGELYLAFRIELRNLRKDCRRKLRHRAVLSGGEKEDFKRRLLETVRETQWELLRNIRRQFETHGPNYFPGELRAPWGERLELYFARYGREWYFGWDRPQAKKRERRSVEGADDDTDEDSFLRTTIEPERKEAPKFTIIQASSSIQICSEPNQEFISAVSLPITFPVAKIVFEASRNPQIHPDTYDGPPPPVSRNVRISPRQPVTHSAQIPKLTPKFRGGMQQDSKTVESGKISWKGVPKHRFPKLFPPPASDSGEGKRIEKSISKDLKRAKSNAMDRRKSWREGGGKSFGVMKEYEDKSTLSAPINRDKSSGDMAPPDVKKSRGSIRSIKSAEFKKMFGIKQDSAGQASGKFGFQRSRSERVPGNASAVGVLRSGGTERKSNETIEDQGSIFSVKTRRRLSLAGPRERLIAARSSRALEKSEIEEESVSELGEEKKHVGSLKGESFLKENGDDRVIDARKGGGMRHERDRILPERVKRKMSFTGTRELHQALKSARETEKDEYVDDDGRIRNAVRRMSSHFSMDDAEKGAANLQAGRRAAGKGSRQHVEFASSPSSASPVGRGFQNDLQQYSLPPKSLPMDLRIGVKPVNGSGPYTRGTSAEPSGNNNDLQMYDVPPTSNSRNRAYQQIFSERPPPLNKYPYRPTLSPVSSRSPIPTTPGERSREVEGSSRMESVLERASVISTRKGNEKERGGVVAGSAVSERNSKASTLAVPVYSHRNAKDIKPLIEEQIESELPKAAEVWPSVSETHTRSLIKKNSSSSTASSGHSGNDSPRFPKTDATTKPKSSPSVSVVEKKADAHSPSISPPTPGINNPQTPTASAIDFWAEADSTLAPSESASAQPPNLRGKPPPKFWLDADQRLDRRGSERTMEEWIAGLPGLGLGTGVWAAGIESDGALDSTLKRGQKEESIDARLEALRRTLGGGGETVEDFIVGERVVQKMEEIMEEDEDETLENASPTLVDPNFLHPDYKPATSVSISHTQPPDQHASEGAKSSTPAANQDREPDEFSWVPTPPLQVEQLYRPGDLATDVTARLDALERYWNEQGLVVGTVLKRMLWIVDSLIVKEREEAQRVMRRREMGWEDEGGEGDGG